MDLGLAGKRALVTGSSAGIGAGIARMLAAEGCIVVVHGRDADRATRVAEDIRQAGGVADLVIGDLADEAQAEAVARQAGAVDILVNNAGGAAGTSAMEWTEVPDDGWFQTYNGNVLAAVRMIRPLLPAMKAKGWGRIVNIASAAAAQPIAFGPDYAAAKAAMINMSVSLAKAMGPCGVTANSVSPGMVLTPAVERWLESMRGPMGWEGLEMAELEQRAASHLTPTLVGRIGRVEDVAHAVCMLASPAAGYMTGANIRVDGGQVQSIN